MENERLVTLVALYLVDLFYIVTVAIFLLSGRSRLNWALALQKAIWFFIITLIVIPPLQFNRVVLDRGQRIPFWVLLTIATGWVLIEVYLQNRGVIWQTLKWRMASDYEHFGHAVSTIYRKGRGKVRRQ